MPPTRPAAARCTVDSRASQLKCTCPTVAVSAVATLDLDCHGQLRCRLLYSHSRLTVDRLLQQSRRRSLYSHSWLTVDRLLQQLNAQNSRELDCKPNVESHFHSSHREHTSQMRCDLLFPLPFTEVFYRTTPSRPSKTQKLSNTEQSTAETCLCSSSAHSVAPLASSVCVALRCRWFGSDSACNSGFD